MKQAKIVSAAVMTLAMLPAFAGVSAYARGGGEPTVITQSDSDTGAMTATYDAQPSYTVTIPASAKIADDAQNAVAQSITAKDVLLESGKQLVVKLESAGNTTDVNATTFNAKNGDSTVTYNILNGENKNIALGSNVAEFKNQTGEQTVALKFVKEPTSTPTVAGKYTETLTFGIAVENANPYAAAQVGDEVQFGKYDWYVIKKSDNGVTLLMKNNFMEKAYNDSKTSVTWATCTLRTYLNGEFYNSFSADEKAKIVKTSNTNPPNPDWSTNGGNDTEDYIYLLSIAEADALSDTIRADSNGSWWLRSPGDDSVCAAFVSAVGDVSVDGKDVDRDYGVRPALNLEF